MGQFIIVAYFGLAIWLLRWESRRREETSAALWIPTIWIAIALSRPLSLWLGFGGNSDALQGSPLDRLFHLFCIVAAFIVLHRRGLRWSAVIIGNWPIFLFYAFFLVSVVWADSPFVSFKRWFKDFGLVALALVILTEKNQIQAIRLVFVRCAYLWLPLSVILIRWFPSMGRIYSSSGGVQLTGVTTQKNSLGITAMICGIIFLWDWLERRKRRDRRHSVVQRQDRLEGVVLFGGMAAAIYLLHLSQSKTSLICFLIATVIITASYVSTFEARIGRFGVYVLVAGFGIYLLDMSFGVTDLLLGSIGRDSSFTGRTKVWEAILSLETNPLIGTGFYSFWSDDYFQSQLPAFVAHSTHNGYLETYVDGGWIGIAVLSVMLVSIWIRINRDLKSGSHYAVVRLACYIAIIIGCFSESHFGRLGPLWFLFILTSIEPRSAAILGFRASNQFRKYSPITPKN
jgi:O-antigen ligase